MTRIAIKVSEDTLQRWAAMKAQWDALQIELKDLSRRWDAERWARENPPL